MSSSETPSFIAPNGQTVTPSDLVSLYREYARIPSPGKAFIRPPLSNGAQYVTVNWSSRDCEQQEVSSHTKVYRVSVDSSNPKKVQVERVSDCLDTSAVVLSTTSNSGQRTAVLKTKTKDGKEKQYIDILTDSWKEKSIDVELELSTGAVITKSPFSGMIWSPDEKHLAVVCEGKVPKSESFFTPKKASTEPSKNGAVPGEEYFYKEDWGEALDGVVHPVICILDLSSSDLMAKVVQVNKYSLQSPVWINGNTFLFIGVNEETKKLGVIYCTNRPSVIYKWSLDSDEPTVLYDGSTCIRCLRSSPSGKVVFLENSTFGPHFKASQLVSLDVLSGKRDVLVDLDIRGHPELRALYVDDLPKRCWSYDESFVVFHVITLGYKRIVKVDITKKEISTLFDAGKFVLDFDGKTLVGSSSTITKRPASWVSFLKDGSWTEPAALEEEIIEKNLEYSVVEIPTEESLSIQTFLVAPSQIQSSSAPTFVCIHGGPHSMFCDSFMSPLAMFAQLGFKSLLINYRGSAGFDEKMVNSLPTHVGTKDVKDCIACVDHFVQKGLIDPKNLILYGGSHGGFLVTHLSGQYAHYDWLACATRNPVTDLAGMTEATDIPDWCWTEGFGENYKFDRVLTDEELLALSAKSPIRWVHQVKTPTIVFLGSNDRRVPMTQGLKWYQLLKARGVKTKCLVYKDKHDLYKVEVDSDYFVNTMLWVLGEFDARRWK